MARSYSELQADGERELAAQRRVETPVLNALAAERRSAATREAQRVWVARHMPDLPPAMHCFLGHTIRRLRVRNGCDPTPADIEADMRDRGLFDLAEMTEETA